MSVVEDPMKVSLKGEKGSPAQRTVKHEEEEGNK